MAHGPSKRFKPTRGLDQALRREQQSVSNCLLSIFDDARFVQEISALYPSLPVFANLRCGLWYVPNATATCYFKSTDGHTGNWGFSCTRLNLHVAAACAQQGGAIVVDATRRGKRFPVRIDAPFAHGLFCLADTHAPQARLRQAEWRVT